MEEAIEEDKEWRNLAFPHSARLSRRLRTPNAGWKCDGAQAPLARFSRSLGSRDRFKGKTT